MEVENTRADKGRYQRSDNLSDESVTRRDLDIVGQLEIVGKVDCLSRGDVSVGFEVVHRESISRGDLRSNQLGQDVHGDLHSGDGVDKTNLRSAWQWSLTHGNDKDQSHADTEQYHGGSGVGLIASDTDHSGNDGDSQDDQIPPLGYLFVTLHQFGVDVFRQIVVFVLGDDLSAPGKMLESSLEANGNLLSVEQEGIRNGYCKSQR